MTDPLKQREAIEAAAADWVIRLGGDPLRPEEQHALEAWLAENPDHHAAFDFARATWGDLAALRSAPGALTRENLPRFVPKRSRPRLWIQAGALAASVLVALGLGAVWFGDPIALLAADHRTAPGMVQTVSLPDGSRIDLGPASAIALKFSEKERRIELLTGTLHATVAPTGAGEGRPFVVEAGNGTTTALGTQFVVERMADAVEVIVTEHQVRVAVATDASSDVVASGAAPSENMLVLSIGESVRYDRAGGLAAVHPVNVDLAMAWRTGRLVFDRRPLTEVIEELNRYRHGRIVLADAALGARTVSGVFDAARLDEALAIIVRELGARSLAVPPLVTVLY